MNDDALEAKFKHLGDSIDKVRDEGRERGKRQERATGEIKDELKMLNAETARHDERIKTVEHGVKFNRELIWKILATLATAGLALDKIFH